MKTLLKYLKQLTCVHDYGIVGCCDCVPCSVPDAPGRPCNDYTICKKCGKSKCLPYFDHVYEPKFCTGKHNTKLIWIHKGTNKIYWKPKWLNQISWKPGEPKIYQFLWWGYIKE